MSRRDSGNRDNPRFGNPKEREGGPRGVNNRNGNNANRRT